jgi:SNF2 family DNA or RNA helicase
MSVGRSKTPSASLGPSNLFDYQRVAVQHILDHPQAMLWLDMGLGKTIVSLGSFADLQDRGLVSSALVIAPLRVIQTVWAQEARKWSHTAHLRFSLIHGSRAQRMLALRRKADVYLINPENMEWLAGYAEHLWLKRGQYLPWSCLICDEITKFKNATRNRSRALQRLVPYFTRRIGLTGEPAANGYPDLYGQYLVIDKGQRLGQNVTSFRAQFLKQAGYAGFSWACTRTGKDQIHAKIADITLEQSAVQHLDLPPIRDNVVWVDLPPDARRIYDKLEHDLFVELDSGAELDVANQANLINKLCQVASGAAYLVPGGPWEEIHRAKLDALDDLLEESGGRPLLLGYTYIHEAERLRSRFPEQSRFLSSSLGVHDLNALLDAWGRDEVPLLCGHPASMGHGLNLQGSSARASVWLSLPWSLELYNQMNARLFGGHRRQGSSVIHHILARNTVDEVILSALQGKSTTQAALKAAITKYRETRR